MLTPLRSSRDVLDQHADQLAAAMAVAREEGLRQARATVETAVAGHEAAQLRLDAAAAAFSSAARQLLDNDVEIVEAVQQQAVMFAVSLAEELLGRELRSCDDAVLGSVERAMALMPERGSITLRLNSGDLAAVESFMGELPSLALRVELTPDAAIERGGCVAVVGSLRIDAQLGAAFERTRAALRA